MNERETHYNRVLELIGSIDDSLDYTRNEEREAARMLYVASERIRDAMQLLGMGPYYDPVNSKGKRLSEYLGS